jgi:membrane protease YdiL (CAAX protease family)
MSMRFSVWVERSPLVAYFALVFGIEWLLTLLLSSVVPPMFALLIGAWLPNIVGVFVTGVANGRAGLRELFRRVVRWHIGLRWYVIALLLPTSLAFLSIGWYVALGNTMPRFTPGGQLLPILLLAVFTGAMGEELGWRGTALPRLLARWNALDSSLVLGVVWGLYHLPSFLLSGLPLKGMPLVSFMVAVLGLTTLVTWTFNHTGGSLIPVFLYHMAFNFIGNATGIFGNPALFRIFAIMCCVAGVAVITLDWARFTQPVTASAREWSQHSAECV